MRFCMHCQALIFDLDGVLIDAEFIYRRHWQRWADRHQVSFDHILQVHYGSPAQRTMEIVAPHLNAFSEAQHFNSLLEADMNMEGTIALPGVHFVLNQLPGDRWAIATSASQKIALARLAYLKLPIPTVLIAPENVQRGKPAPEPYLKAAADLGYAVTDCLVIEDAPAGIQGGSCCRGTGACCGNHP